MSVISFVAGDRFIARTIKHLATNPANRWANSYEFIATDVGSESEVLDLATKLVEFEANFHYTSVVYDRLIFSTWEADSVPYDPDAFFATTLTQEGLIVPTTDQLALDSCLSVARVAASGRFGHIFYRACVSEEDTNAPAGKMVLVNRATFQSRISGSLTDSGLDAHIGTGAGVLKMCMVNKDGSNTRNVVELVVQGMSGVPTDHAWFNRTSH